MTTPRPNRALETTRRWTAGAMLASTLAAGGIGAHLAWAYASTGTSSTAAGTRGDDQGTSRDDQGDGSGDSFGQSSGGFGSVLGLTGSSGPSQSGTHGS